ncbi:zinc finger, CCHC-type containing protein, partial [Tanacetum coccineum]
MILRCAGSLKANLQHIEALSTTEAGYMTFTEAWKKEIWLKGILTESRYELRLVAGIATSALVKGGSRSEVSAQVEVATYRLNIKKLDGNIVQKHGGSKQVGLKQLGYKQVGFKQLGHGVETGVHRVQVEKHVWFEVELQGAQENHEDVVFQVSNDDAAVTQRRLEGKQLEENTNTDCLVKEQEKVHLDGVFRVKDVRNLLDETFLPKADTPTRWIKSIPIKVNVFVWKALQDRRPTRSNLVRRNILIDSLSCLICDGEPEDSSHLFFRCCLTRDVT